MYFNLLKQQQKRSEVVINDSCKKILPSQESVYQSSASLTQCTEVTNSCGSCAHFRKMGENSGQVVEIC